MPRFSALHRQPRLAALCLLVLAPAIGELLSGSAPPVEFFQPFAFLLLACLYGGGALLVREAVVAWRKGLLALLLLGAAYAIAEEALMVKSFFDPHWVDLGPLGRYGRAWGVNWVWSVGLTLYHTVVSIAVPIQLIHLAFPAWARERWLDRRTIWVLAAAFCGVLLLGYLALTPYRPPWSLYLPSAAVIGVLVFLARCSPAESPRPASSRPAAGPARFFWLGFLLTLGWFVCFWGLPQNNRIPPLLVIALLLAIPAGGLRLGARMSGGAPLPPRQSFAWAAGVLSFFVPLGFLREFAPNQPDNPRGMAVVAAAAALLLLWAGRRLRYTSTAAVPGGDIRAEA